jgi:hypothetical protein
MAQFELEWSAVGSATIEADDADEAADILAEGLRNLDSSMFDEVDVEEITVDSTTQREDDK